MLQAAPLLVLLASLLPQESAAQPAAPAGEPAQAPQAEEPRGLVLSAEGAFQGYTLFAPLRSTTTWLVDMAGEAVHSWPNAHPPGNSVYLFDDGTLLRCARMDNDVFFGGGQGGRVELLAWDGSLLWELDWSDERRMHHHDVEPLPNGNLLLISWVYKSVEEALAVGRDPRYVGEHGFWPDSVFEIEPTLPKGGKIVWEWHSFDHLIQDLDPTKQGYGDVTRRPERIDVNGEWRDRPPASAAEFEEERRTLEQMRQLGYVGDDDDGDDDGDDGGRDPGRKGREPGKFEGDWLHTNAIDYHPEHDLILLSVRTFDEIWVIDHSTTTAEARGSTGGRWKKGGDLLWRWGNPRTYGAGGVEQRRLYVQHDAQWIEAGRPGAGNVLVFNNGQGREPPFSSVDEIVPPFDPARGFTRVGRAFGPEAPAWSYVAPERESFYSSFISGAQRLPNGNTLICEGAKGRLFEVTHEGAIVWEYLNPFGGDAPARGRRPARKATSTETPGTDGQAAAPPPEAPQNPIPKGLFRATRLAPDHPGLARLRN